MIRYACDICGCTAAKPNKYEITTAKNERNGI